MIIYIHTCRETIVTLLLYSVVEKNSTSCV